MADDPTIDLLKRFGMGATFGVPAMLPGLAGLPYSIRKQYELMTGGDYEPNPGTIMSVSKSGAELADSIMQKGRSTFDIEGHPEGFLQNAAEIGGSFATGGGVARLAANAPKLVRGAIKIVAPAPETVKGGVAGTAALAGAATGLQALAAPLDEQAGAKEQDAPVANVEGSGDDQTGQDGSFQQELNSTLFPKDNSTNSFQNEVNAALKHNTATGVDNAFQAEVSKTLATANTELGDRSTLLGKVTENIKENWKPYTAVALAIGAGLVARKLATARQSVQMAGELTGPAAETSTLGVGTRLKGAFVDSNAPLEASYKARSPADAEAFNARLSTAGNPIAIQKKVEVAQHSGDLPEGLKYQFTPKMWYDGRAMLRPDESSLLNDALIARSELAGRANASRQALAAGKPYNEIYTNSFGKTDTELQAIVDASANNPAVRLLMNRYDQIMQTSLEYLERAKIITPTMRTELTQNFPHYVPFIEGKPQGLVAKILDHIEQPSTKDVFMDLTNLQKREGGLGKVADPGSAMERYIGHIIRTGEQNKIRSMWSENMLRSQSPINKLVTEVSNPSEASIMYFKDGVRKYVNIADETIKSALEFAPKSVSPMVNGIRKGYQAAATGLLAPLYAFKAISYDAWQASITSPKGFGLYRGEPASAIIEAMAGLSRASYGHITKGLRDGLQKALVADELGKPSMLGSIMPRAALARAADIASTAFENSVLALAERQGAIGGGRYTEHLNMRTFQTQMKYLSPDAAAKFPTATRFMDAYRAAMDSFQNATRLQYMAKEYGARFSPMSRAKIQAKTLQEADQITSDVRNLTGDYAKRGSSKYAIGYAESVPYGNVSLQSANNWAQAIARRPFKTALGVTNGIFVPVIASQIAGSHDPEWLAMEAARTPYERASTISLYIPGLAAKDQPHIPLLQELGPLKVMFEQLTDALFGFSNGMFHDGSMRPMKDAMMDMLGDKVMGDFWTALQRGTPPWMPIGVPLVANAAGYNVQTGGDSLFRVNEINRKQVSDPAATTSIALPHDAGTAADLVHNNMAQAVFGDILSAASQVFFATMGSAEMGYRGSGGDISRAAIDAMSELSSQARQQLPMFPMLWDTPRRQGMQTFENKAAQDKLHKMTELKSMYDVYVRNANNVPLPGGGVKQDANFTRTASDFSKMIFASVASFKAQNEQLLDLRTKILFDIDQNSANVAARPDTRVQTRNELIHQLSDVNALLLERIKDREMLISQRFGRKIDIMKVTRKSEPQDFAPLD